jgi:hypothetical protein
MPGPQYVNDIPSGLEFIAQISDYIVIAISFDLFDNVSQYSMVYLVGHINF